MEQFMKKTFLARQNLKKIFVVQALLLPGKKHRDNLNALNQDLDKPVLFQKINFIAPPDGDVALNTFTNSMNTSPYQVYDEKLEHELASQYGYNRGGVYRKTKRNQKRRKNKTTKKSKKTKRNRMIKRRHIKYK
jgi:hypothetical protein